MNSTSLQIGASRESDAVDIASLCYLGGILKFLDTWNTSSDLSPNSFTVVLQNFSSTNCDLNLLKVNMEVQIINFWPPGRRNCTEIPHSLRLKIIYLKCKQHLHYFLQLYISTLLYSRNLFLNALITSILTLTRSFYFQ